MGKRRYIRQQGFGNAIMPDGKSGFRFQVELPGEGGTNLARYFPLVIELDGFKLREDSVSISLDGRYYFSVSDKQEMANVFWYSGEVGEVFVQMDKPLEPGLHKLQATFGQGMFGMAGPSDTRYLTCLGTDNSKAKIKRGVSFYSYREAINKREMTLQDCIAESLKFGADGIEMVTVESVQNYPYPTNEFYRYWNGLRERYSFTPVSLDSSNINPNPFDPMPDDLNCSILSRDLYMAKRMGFPMIRIAVVTPVSVIEKLVSTAEKLGVSMAIEVHPPFSMASPWMEERLNLFERIGSPMLGLIPDLGIFALRVAPERVAQMIRNGVNSDVINKATLMFEQGKGVEEALEEAKRLAASERDLKAVNGIYHNIYDDPNVLVKNIKYIKNIHGKFYEMDDHMQETSLDYTNVVKALVKAGYDGYICSEYEGQLFAEDYDALEEVEQLRRQHLMIQNLLK